MSILALSILVLLILPIDATYFLGTMVGAIVVSGEYHPATVVIALVVLGSVGTTLIALILQTAPVKRALRRRSPRTLAWVSTSLALISLGFFVAGGIYAKVEDDAVARSRDQPALISKGLPHATPENVSPSTTLVPNPRYEEYDNEGVALMLWAGLVFATLSLALAYYLLRLRRHRRWLVHQD